MVMYKYPIFCDKKINYYLEVILTVFLCKFDS